MTDCANLPVIIAIQLVHCDPASSPTNKNQSGTLAPEVSEEIPRPQLGSGKIFVRKEELP